jgi:hypothetical protein
VATRSKQRGYLRRIEGSEIQSGGFTEKKRTVFGGHDVAKSSRSLSVNRAIEGGGETGEHARSRRKPMCFAVGRSKRKRETDSKPVLDPDGHGSEQT